MVGAGLTARAWAEPAGDLPDEPTNGVSSGYGIGAPFSPGPGGGHEVGEATQFAAGDEIGKTGLRRARGSPGGKGALGAPERGLRVQGVLGW